MGYLPAQRECQQSCWELDFTDRTALPIGSFDQEGALIGCARLVFPLGKEVHHLSIIEELVYAQRDVKLRENLAYPAKLTHPFDLLESLKGFREYYQGIVRKGLRKAELSRVIVAPEHRRQGVGEVLVDSLVSLARQHQLQVLFLACNMRHRSFYENCGFHVLEGLECDNFAGVNAPAIAMARELTTSMRGAGAGHRSFALH